MIAEQQSPRVCMIQDGARLHYATPIALQRVGILEQVFTDWYNKPGSVESVASKLVKLFSPASASRMAQRFASELDAEKVQSCPRMMWDQLRHKHRFNSEVEYFAWMSQRFGRWLLRQDLSKSNIIFGFVRNVSPEFCNAARLRGLKIVTDQIIAPYEFECSEMRRQIERFPGWDNEGEPNDRMLTDFERQTWAASDRITCASEFVSQQLIACGVAKEKIAVIPYPFDSGSIQPTDRRNRPEPMTVGFLGKVGLRKGAPYVFEIARRFDPAKVRFVMVGPVRINPAILEKHRGAVEVVGPVPRGSVHEWLDRFDVFLLPSTCEGSAGAVSEAMASGLPVITSPNSGSLVRHGVDGYICPYDNVDAMAEYIEQLSQDRQRRHEMGLAGRGSIERWNLDQYGETLENLIWSVLSSAR